MSGTLRQATCVLIEERAVLVEGPPGIGKSSLALALIDRGALLVGDDGVSLALREGRLWASPPPATSGLIEIRNVGLVEMPAGEGPVALLVTLDQAAPRHVEEAGTTPILGTGIPTLALFPAASALPLRVEWALGKHGLTR